LSEAFVWWLTVELLGLIALPFAVVLFKRLPDRGYAFGKALSILVVSFLVWLAASAHILPNARWAIILVIALLACGSAFMFIRRRHQLTSYVRENRGVIITVEVLFVLAFVIWAVVRAYNPEILWTEKPMDFAIINGIMRSEYFPPLDPWLSGFSLNNYYFGHMMMATLTKLTGIPSAVTFNLSVALVYGLASIGAFGVAYNLVKLSRGGNRAAIGFGLVAAGFLLILGNLEGVLEMLHSHGVGSEGFWSWIGIEGMTAPYHSEHWYPTDFWWWWRATRMTQVIVGDAFLDYTIAEFPIFTFILGDLHAHLMSLPFVLLCVGVCLNVVATDEPLGLGWLRRNLVPFAMMLVCVGSLGAIHTWDLPIYLFLFIGAMFLQTRLRGTGERWWKGWGALSAITVVGVFLLYLPFYLNMDSPVSGILPWLGPDTRLFHSLVFWGLFIFICVSFVLTQIRSGLRSVSWRRVCLLCLAVLVPWVVWAIVVEATGGGVSIGGKLWPLLFFLVILALVLIVAVSRLKRGDKDGRGVVFALYLFFAALLLIVGCELFHVDDVFGNRMNTVFRFYYQAWVFFSVASAFALYYVYRHWRAPALGVRLARYGWWGLVVLLVACSIIYSVAATWSKTEAFWKSPTVDGLAWLEGGHPEELAAINWLNANVPGAPVIVEIPGNCYTDESRVSASTGLPTILGWEHHEWVWRGSSRDFMGRRMDVDYIYTGEDLEKVEALLERYDVTYVYVGRLETSNYGAGLNERFGDFMDVVFEAPGNEPVVIYSRVQP